MKRLIITRHKALIEWLAARGIEGETRDHLEINYLPNILGDNTFSDLNKEGITEVWGVLPIPLVAQLNKLGIRVMVVALNMPAELRGKELSLSEMEQVEVTINETSVKLTEVELSPVK